MVNLIVLFHYVISGAGGSWATTNATRSDNLILAFVSISRGALSLKRWGTFSKTIKKQKRIRKIFSKYMLIYIRVDQKMQNTLQIKVKHVENYCIDKKLTYTSWSETHSKNHLCINHRILLYFTKNWMWERFSSPVQP